MKKTFLFMLCLGLASSCYATWQIAGASVRTAGNQPNQIIDNTPPSYRANPAYDLQTQPNSSLYSIINNYAGQHSWQVNWKAKNKRYPINVQSTIGGNNVPEVLNRLLANYPLHASYDKRHKIVTIMSNK